MSAVLDTSTHPSTLRRQPPRPAPAKAVLPAPLAIWALRRNTLATWGDPAYELANAFRNPKGAADLQRDPARISHLARIWSQGLDIERTRLLQWAAVKCALSIAWRAKGVLRDDKEADLLSLLLHHAEHV